MAASRSIAKLVASSVVLVCATSASKSSELKLVMMPEEGLTGRGAVCLDGSDAGFYWRPAANEKDRNKWQIYFQGGGWCYNEVDCWARSRTGLGSSLYFPDAHSPDGLMSGDCDMNPDFCNFNRVFIAYCDGASFSGNRAESISVTGLDGQEKKLYFRGRRIVDAVLDTLSGDKYGLKNAQEVMLTGCSAGGLATILHTDYIHSALQKIAPKLERYKAVPMSGYFLMHDSLEGEPIYQTEIRSAFELANATSANQHCIDAVGNPKQHWKCYFAEFSHGFTQAPIFSINSAFDWWQAYCILDSKLVEGFPQQSTEQNGACAISSFTWRCLNSGGRECLPTEKDAIEGYAQSFVNTIQKYEAYSKKGNGFFTHTCYTHCEAETPKFQQFQINGVTMQQAVSKWWHSDLDATEKHTYAPCKYHKDSGDLQCNPSCDGAVVEAVEGEGRAKTDGTDLTIRGEYDFCLTVCEASQQSSSDTQTCSQACEHAFAVANETLRVYCRGDVCDDATTETMHQEADAMMNEADSEHSTLLQLKQHEAVLKVKNCLPRSTWCNSLCSTSISPTFRGATASNCHVSCMDVKSALSMSVLAHCA